MFFLRAVLTIFLLLFMLLSRPIYASEQSAITLNVDNRQPTHLISPLIYGVNMATETQAEQWNLPINRWGGNALTRYNWKIDVYNPGNYWYFENINNWPELPTFPVGTSADRWVQQNKRTNTQSLIQLPILGWVAKDRTQSCGFHWDKYGWQQDTDWSYRWGCGNGIHGGTGAPITGNDPTDTSVAVGPSFSGEWVQHLVTQFGRADQGGVQLYALDNEPMIWMHNHRDVHPQPTGYLEAFTKGRDVAIAVKQADPSAEVMGPGPWGWPSFFTSSLDSETLDSNPDMEQYGLPFLPWYLQEMKKFELQNGYRLLDYLDIHYYPQAYFQDESGNWNALATGPAGDAATKALRLRATRELWDPSYTAESWVNTQTYTIPRMRAWIDQYYPDTKLAISEYAWGGAEDVNGALAQADVLGIFGRERVDLATLWPEKAITNNSPLDFALRMYRDYDGVGGQFGNAYYASTSTDQDQLSIYASLAGSNGKMTVMVINKTTAPITAPLSFTQPNLGSTLKLFRYSTADTTQIVTNTVAITGSTITQTYPAESISLLELPLLTVPTAVTFSAESSDPARTIRPIVLVVLLTFLIIATRYNWHQPKQNP